MSLKCFVEVCPTGQFVEATIAVTVQTVSSGEEFAGCNIVDIVMHSVTLQVDYEYV